MAGNIREATGRFHDFTLAEALEIARRNDPGEEVPSVSRTLIAHIEALEAERDALREDAERYRWLRGKTNRIDIRGRWVSPKLKSAGRGTSLDAAIDTAREAG